MKSTYFGTGIPTVASLRRSRRHLDHRRYAAERIVAVMQSGTSLHLDHGHGRTWWCLSNGRFVPADVAVIVINHPHVVAIGDGLFHNVPGQTWRFVLPREDSR